MGLQSVKSDKRASRHHLCAEMPMKSLFLLVVAVFVFAASLSAQAPMITSARELRAISGEEAKLKLPVRVRGVVTLVEAARTAFIQDGDAGTFLHLRPDQTDLQPGQIVEAEGVTYAGLYVPGVEPTSLRVVGESPLPTPRPVTVEQLASGVFNYEWVEVRGIVRSVRAAADGHTVLVLALGNGRLEVHANTADTEAAERLLDARIRIAGLAAGFINDRRQLVAPHLRVTDFSAAQVEERGPDDAFALPVTPVAQLLRFHPEGVPGHRVKVSGVVTDHLPGEALFLRDDTRGLLVETTDGPTLAPGDVVEALGFAEMGAFTALLRDSVFRRIAAGEKPEPVAANAKEILKGTHDADLVSLEAQVVDVLRGTSEFTLVLREDDIGFHARLGGEEAAQLEALRPGSRVRLTGVARATQPEFSNTGFSARQRSFEILLRTPADVAVLRTPSAWTARRLATALELLALVAAAALAWVVLLRRQIAAQTAIIRDQARAEAALEERERIAREFHDTLEQELVGVALRLDAIQARFGDTQARELLTGTQRFVGAMQANVKSVLRNLRQPWLEVAALPEAISKSIGEMHLGRRIEVQPKGEVRRLPGVIEHELLRVAQEATTNAIKHGDAQRIGIEVVFAPTEIRLSICDDGRGFDPKRDGEKPGHFGLRGMRERIKKLDGNILIASRPGCTTLEATVPLAR
jgi:signal transduction histidine kinase